MFRPLAAAFLALPLLAPAAQAQTAYPLVCRGGEGMSAVVLPSGQVRIRFIPGTRGAGTAQPGPGSCTWLDRGFRAEEPASLLLVRGNLPGTRYLLDGMLGGATFYVHGYNDAANHAMRVTRVGP